MMLDLGSVLGVITLGLLSPGPDFFLIVKNSLGGSRALAFGTVLGIAAGIGVQMLAISLGLAGMPTPVLRAVQVAGAVFLCYVGVRAVLSRPPPDDAPAAAEGGAGARSGFTEGLLCNLTNAKAFFFFVALFAQFLRPDASLTWRVVLPVTVVVHGAVGWSIVVMAVQSPPVARRLSRAQRWLPRAFGSVLIVFGLLMAWQLQRG